MDDKIVELGECVIYTLQIAVSLTDWLMLLPDCGENTGDGGKDGFSVVSHPIGLKHMSMKVLVY